MSSISHITRPTLTWAAAITVAVAAFLYGTVAESPPQTNADRAHTLAKDFACPVCAGQSVAESDVPVARAIRRQIALWVDEGRSDTYIRDELVAAYNTDIDYTPAVGGVTGLVWVLPIAFMGGATIVITSMFTKNASLSNNAAVQPRRILSSNGTIADTNADTVADPSPASTSNAGAGAPMGGADHDHMGQQRRRRRKRNAVVWGTTFVLVACASGVLITRFSQTRRAGDSITGEISNTTRELIFQAQQAIRDGDMEDAIDKYGEVLELQPSNVEALTYKGWLMSRLVYTGNTGNTGDTGNPGNPTNATVADASLAADMRLRPPDQGGRFRLAPGPVRVTIAPPGTDRRRR